MSDIAATDLGQRLARLGAQMALYTDVARDGMLQGVDVDGSVALAEATGLRVIASGGVASLDDIARLRAVADRGIDGVIVGMALYTGRIHLAEAIAVAEESC